MEGNAELKGKGSTNGRVSDTGAGAMGSCLGALWQREGQGCLRWAVVGLAFW